MQYASINGNGFGGYGETVFGTEGTLRVPDPNTFDGQVFVKQTDDKDYGDADLFV